MEDTSYCYKKCKRGIAAFNDITAESDSVFDAVYDFSGFVKTCKQTCQEANKMQQPINISDYVRAEHNLGTLMAISEYRDKTRLGHVTPYDGTAYCCSDTQIFPKQVGYEPMDVDRAIMEGFTKVLWVSK